MTSRNHPKSPTSTEQRLLGHEILLWLLATVVGVVVSIYMTNKLADIAGLTLVKRYAADIVVAIMSLTWGSWAALLWTRRRAVRSLITLTTQTPALWMIVIGAGLYWFGALTLPIILALVGGGIGLTFISRRLTRTLRSLDTEQSNTFAISISILHPIITAFCVSGFLFLWINQINLFDTLDIHTIAFLEKLFPNFTNIICQLTWKSVLAVSAISTIIPAFISELFSRMIRKRAR